MSDKQQTGEPGDPRDTDGAAAGPGPEDEVTSELAGILARAFGDEGSIPDDVRITDIQLSSHVDVEADSTLEPGSLLGDRFEIVELVHSGGMGHVYKAIDHRRHPEGSGQVHVAIKILRESLSGRDQFRRMLEREAAKAQTLSHPNIINIFDFDEHDGRFFLVMEWLEGESVNALLRRTGGQRLSPAFAWAVIEGAAAAIRHAHLNNIVHADINPANIFITATHDIKLLDFGVARRADDKPRPAEDRVYWVTQNYASPEVLSGLDPVFQDDVFSLGCVAYRLLGGSHPFGGAPSIVARQKGMVVEPIPGLPESDWRILSRSLAYARSDRPETVTVFLRSSSPTVGGRGRAPALAFLRWVLPVAAAVAAALAIGVWFRPDLPGASTVPATSQEPVVLADSEATSEQPTPVETLLAAAEQAVAEQRLVLPDGDNARAWYRELLAIEPDNADALRGLRSISDAFVQRADAALRSGDPQLAGSALLIASDTDAANPAISIISELLVAQGNARLSAARMAAATGDIEQASAALAEAERYEHIDAGTIVAMRDQLAALVLDAALLDRLAVADEHIASGRLLEPAGNNAREVLDSLRDEYGRDTRLLEAYHRLGERLLTRAAFATAAGSVGDAVILIDAADALGVLEPEVALARAAVARVANAPPEPELAARPAADDTAAAVELDSADTPSAVPVAAVVEAGPIDAAPDLPADSAAVTPDEPQRSPARRLEDLGLVRFVAPAYPRSARRRGLTGHVEVAFDVTPDGRTAAIEIVGSVPEAIFDESAIDAVRQWRFSRREESSRASITLRFAITD